MAVINIIHGDCMESMRSMPDKAYDLAIVDPPYGIGMAEWDLAPSEDYFAELWRVADRSIIWGGNYFPLPPTEGWLCWNKIHGFKTPLESMSDFELAWTSFLDKGRIIPLSCSGNIIGGKVDYKYKPIHPTQKPVALYKLLLKNYAKPGDKILDTHGGSCSIAIACDIMGFDLDCYEIDLDYWTAATERFQRHKRQEVLPL